MHRYRLLLPPVQLPKEGLHACTPRPEQSTRQVWVAAQLLERGDGGQRGQRGVLVQLATRQRC